MDINSKVESLQQELIVETQNLLKIRSVTEEPKPGMPFGEGIGHALDHTLHLGRRLGFKTCNVDGYMAYIEYGAGEEMVGILGHLDVVPEGDGWDYDPYAAEIHDGKIYARGALDDKGPIMASIYALYALKETGFNPNKRIRILLGTNEETGTEDVNYYLEREEKPTIGFTPDADFPVIFAEKGLTMFNIERVFDRPDSKLLYIKGGQRHNMVADYCEIGLSVSNADEVISKLNAFAKDNKFNFKYEKAEDKLVIKCYGISAHGSTPDLGKNAVMQSVMFLHSLHICEGETAEVIKFLAEYIGLNTRGEGFGIDLYDEVSGHLSFNVGTIEYDRKNMTLGLNLRYPVTFKLEHMFGPFEEKINAMKFEIKDLDHQEPLYFPKDHKLISTLLKVYENQTGQKAEPIAIGGGTYAKEMPNMVAFGPIFPGKPDLDHQPNEYIEVEDLIKMTKIYAHAIKELSEN